MSGKRIDVAPEGKAATEKEQTPECMMCCSETAKLISCDKCGCGSYCSTKCLELDGVHAMWCPWICRLEKHENQKRMSKEINLIDSEKSPYGMKLQLVKLVGERPLVKIRLDGKRIQGLWDTGAMISLVNEEFMQDNLSRTYQFFL